MNTGWIIAGAASAAFLYFLGVLSGIRLAHEPDLFIHRRRQVWRAWWHWISRHHGGRPRLSPELVELIRHLSRENPLWGAPRIHGELLKLDQCVSQSSVSRYMIRRHGRPQQSWKTFLINHAPEIVSVDMLTVPTRESGSLYAFVVLGLGRRAILLIEVTTHPTAQWLAQQVTEAFPWDAKLPRFIVRDNDGAYGRIYRQRLYAMGIRDHPVAPHSPWQNGYVERVIGTIRRECLDHIDIRGAKHLRRVLRQYADYYSEERSAPADATLQWSVASDERPHASRVGQGFAEFAGRGERWRHCFASNSRRTTSSI